MLAGLRAYRSWARARPSRLLAHTHGPAQLLRGALGRVPASTLQGQPRAGGGIQEGISLCRSSPRGSVLFVLNKICSQTPTACLSFWVLLTTRLWNIGDAPSSPGFLVAVGSLLWGF